VRLPARKQNLHLAAAGLPESSVSSRGFGRRQAACAQAGINLVQYQALRQDDAGNGTNQEDTK
jgi:hypothetical protein